MRVRELIGLRSTASWLGPLLGGMILVFSSISPCQTRAFDPSNQRSISASNDIVSVRLIRREPCRNCPSVSRFKLEIREKEGTKTHSFSLANETAQIDEIHLLGAEKLIVFGRVLANTSIVTIVDLSTRQITDSFFCFSPSISPNGRMVAFQKVYPAHFVSEVSAVYLLYNVRAGAEANRSHRIPLNNRIDVGKVIFPEGADNRPGENLNVPSEKRHTMVSQQFYWRSDSSAVLFADRHAGKNSIVWVDLSEPPNMQTAIVSLPTDEIIDSAMCQDFKGRLEEAFHIINIQWQEAENRARLHFRSLSPSCLKVPTLAISLPTPRSLDVATSAFE